MSNPVGSPPTVPPPTSPVEHAERWVTARLTESGFHTTLEARQHRFAADEPEPVGGSDRAPTPYELLLASLGACTAMTLRMYAARKGWALDQIVVRLRPTRDHAVDCVNCESHAVGVDVLERELELVGTLTPEQRQRLAAIADRCPVKQSLERGIRIVAAAGTPRTAAVEGAAEATASPIPANPDAPSRVEDAP